ncbi:hypothetical protein EGW08_023296 [Elysia chlorotica]|uniref:CUB domain-containing protein n=1 Tax=Elysia chlorotica TaxID=188477 RepID=A0A3S0Z449_ELYCH|nr:hypothetical protein EGW08_023296 [Elysia chlorotica]
MERTEISLSPTYFWLVIMLREAIGAATFQTVNMHDHSVCSTKNPYIVTENLGYKVQLKSPTKDSALHSCSVTFRAGNTTTQICIVQEYPRIQVTHSDCSFVAVNADNTFLFNVAYGGSWEPPEQCFGTRTISFMVLMQTSNNPALVSHLTLNLKVLDISSHERRVDLAYDGCERTYDMNRSQISVYNRQKPQALRNVDAHELKIRCQAMFRRLSGNKFPICIGYEPLGTPDCSSDWTLLVLKVMGNLDPGNILLEIDCAKDPRARQNFEWCATHHTDNITLLHWRKADIPVMSNQEKPERPESYRIRIGDFSREEFIDLKEKAQAAADAAAAAAAAAGGGGGGGGGGETNDLRNSSGFLANKSDIDRGSDCENMGSTIVSDCLTIWCLLLGAGISHLLTNDLTT